MTRAPFVMGKAAEAVLARRRDLRHHDRLALRQPADGGGATAPTRCPRPARTWPRTSRSRREDQDAFALRSQQKAAAAQAERFFAREIVPVTIRAARATRRCRADEHPRADTTLEALAKLKTPFRKPGTVTAGNASGVNDGAAALSLASEDAARRHGLEPRARVVAMATAGVEPRIMGIGPVPATRKLLERTGLTLERDRRDRAQRGVREPGPCRAAPARPAGRRRAGQPARRRHRARPSARDVAARAWR